MGVTAEIRHRQIVEQLNLTGRVSVTELSKILRVTEVTIRRDLQLLAKSGLLKKTYGGAVLVGPGVQVSVRYRHTHNLGAKRIIGKLASDLINDGDIIYLEAGSTCYEIIPHIANRQGLTIIVNSLYLMHRLHELTGHKVVIVGGQYRSERMDMVGSLAEVSIAQLGGFKAFTGADDITIEAGISGADVVTVGFAKLVLKRASEVIFVGDHTKFDKPALYKIADIDALDYIITDIKPSQDWHRAAKEHNIRLIYPKEA
jgi:DeoR/GlpR family transcriptional regulator of sugar metabolism